MIWDYFIYFAIMAIMLWAVGAFLAWKEKTAGVYASTLTGLAVFFTFIVIMWVTLERPPLRTMGETRLWYSFFLPLAGILVYSRWKYKWILSFSTMLAAVFICINIFKPEIHSKALMPALQSPWFAPHVIVYMFAYALLGAATLMALYQLFFKKGRPLERKEMDITDNLVNVGLAFLTFGMLFGALWAKEAWEKHGATIGHGIPRRLGRPLPGLLIWAISIIASIVPSPSSQPCGCCSSLSSCCRSAGGASTTCRLLKAPAYIPIPPDITHNDQNRTREADRPQDD